MLSELISLPFLAYQAYLTYKIPGELKHLYKTGPNIHSSNKIDKSNSSLLIKEISKYKWIDDTDNNRVMIQALFFSALFSTLGYLSKIDGVSTQDERDYTNRFIEGLELSQKLHYLANNLFKEGIRSDFKQIKNLISVFSNTVAKHKNLLTIFLETLIGAVFIDTQFHNREKTTLAQIAVILGISREKLDELIKDEMLKSDFVSPEIQFHNQKSKFKNACDLLGISYACNLEEATKAYRKKINNYHPDKLESQGLPKEIYEAATRKAVAIQKAYELIKKII